MYQTNNKKGHSLIMFQQTTLKKFVLPVLVVLIVQTAILPVQSDQNDFSRFILKISMKQTFAENLSMKNRHKSADWFIRKSKKGNPRKLEHSININLLNQAQGITSRLQLQGVKIAIDVTKIPVYSKSKSKFITGGQAEKGTTRFYKFLGFSIIERQVKFPVYTRLLEKEDWKDIHKLIEEGLQEIGKKMVINEVLLDRGFIGSKIVQRLQLNHYSFVIAFRRSKKLKNIFSQLDDSAVSSLEQFSDQETGYMVTRKSECCWVISEFSYGKPQVKVNLVIWRVKKKNKKRKDKNRKFEYFLYITDVSVNPLKVYELYGTRWRIETAFRQIKNLHAKTRVIDPVHRIWLFGTACLIYASWIYQNAPKDIVSVIPEELINDQIKKLYKQWQYGRITLYKMVDIYLILLDQPSFFVS
jgi:hypothetical protein